MFAREGGDDPRRVAPVVHLVDFGNSAIVYRVKFWVAYEFKNPVLQRVLTFQRAHAAARVMRAFEDEAKRRLAPDSN